MEAKLDMVLEQVGRDKNIDKSVLINALEVPIVAPEDAAVPAAPTPTN